MPSWCGVGPGDGGQPSNRAEQKTDMADMRRARATGEKADLRARRMRSRPYVSASGNGRRSPASSLDQNVTVASLEQVVVPASQT